jgi:hypothetical protein
MRGNLDHIVGGIGMRLSEIGDNHLVNAAPARLETRSIPSWGLNELPDNGTTGFKRTPQPEHGPSDRAGFRAGKPHDADSAPAGRSNDGDNGVIKIHS